MLAPHFPVHVPALPTRYRTAEFAALASLAALALTACGEISTRSDGDDDGSPGSEPGSEIDGGDLPGSEGSPDASPDGGGGPLPVADADPPASCQDDVTPLLTNAGFEEAKDPPVGAIGWVEDPSPATFPQGQIPVPVPEGSRAAVIGNAAPIEVRLTQPVSVPDATESLRLTFLSCGETEETEQTELDTVQVVLLDEGGDNILELLPSRSNLDASGCPPGWTEFLIDGIPASAGEELQFQLLGTFSDGNQTSFYFDDVALDALGPCPD